MDILINEGSFTARTIWALQVKSPSTSVGLEGSGVFVNHRNKLFVSKNALNWMLQTSNPMSRVSFHLKPPDELSVIVS
jgi:hypothetical protein